MPGSIIVCSFNVKTVMTKIGTYGHELTRPLDYTAAILRMVVEVGPTV